MITIAQRVYAEILLPPGAHASKCRNVKFQNLLKQM